MCLCAQAPLSALSTLVRVSGYRAHLHVCECLHVQSKVIHHSHTCGLQTMGMPMLSAQVEELSTKLDKLQLLESQPASALSSAVMQLSAGVNEFLLNFIHQMRTPTPNIDAPTQALLNNLQACNVYVFVWRFW